MKTIRVHDSLVVIGENILEKLPHFLSQSNITRESPLVIITDTNVAPLYGSYLVELLQKNGYMVHIFPFEAGEASKTWETVSSLIGELLVHEVNRQGVILGLGGGVVGDVTGFVAATYMRGIRYIHLPTTIIASDSSIGGKVGINHPFAKNAVGSFYPPQFVLFDTTLLKTLPERQVRSGFAEIIKHALIQDQGFAQWLMQYREELLCLELSRVTQAIFRSCQIKADIVNEDEKEQGVRKILNYGHTIGHALEAAGGYSKYLHGEAVAIGMCGAAYISENVYGKGVVDTTERILSSFSLPTTYSGHSSTVLLEHMKRDKKRRGDKHSFVLSPGVGRAEMVELTANQVMDGLGYICRREE